MFSTPFFWQMARVVGGALPVRMFLHTFLIPTLVSVVSFFAYNASTSCIVLQFPAQERWSVRRVLEVTNKTSELQRSTRHHMHVIHQTDRVTDFYTLGRVFWRRVFTSCPPDSCCFQAVVLFSLVFTLDWS